ncbi:unnamed protein product [Ambrosiozyma monospora]|uniref:Unnamed protein product n=1 Tax=Ambrosiozyma monospora TaxID=43982 RepID=A0ACB5T2E2_AMBMO|nr:unnamed protein product [Ambrosiozyma monospora]
MNRSMSSQKRKRKPADLPTLRRGRAVVSQPLQDPSRQSINYITGSSGNSSPNRSKPGLGISSPFSKRLSSPFAPKNAPRSAPIGSTIADDDGDLGDERFLRHEPVQFHVKFHDQSTWQHDVILDPSLVPGARIGDVGEIESLQSSSRKIYFTFRKFTPPPNKLSPNSLVNNNRMPSRMNYISILSGDIPRLLNLELRSAVLVRLKKKEIVEADVVEVYVKDLHLSRGDMWNMSAELQRCCLHRTERLQFKEGAVRGVVRRIYRNGTKVFSAYVGENTKIVYRSESARFIIFIQASAEMWHFEESGQQMFHKFVNSLFPKIFQKWKESGTNHLITIVLFTSVDPEEENISKYKAGETPPNRQNYYRVVVDQVSILLWEEIMAALRLEFTNFKKEILLSSNMPSAGFQSIQGAFLPAVKGNLFEAINLGMSLVSDDFSDPDLRHTTNHFIIISPGSGLFDVDYSLLSASIARCSFIKIHGW